MTLPPSSSLPQSRPKAALQEEVDLDLGGLPLPTSPRSLQAVLGLDRNYPASEEQKIWISSSEMRPSQQELGPAMAYITLSDMDR